MGKLRPRNLIFHSDQGGQYKSSIFKKCLTKHNVTQSYSKTGCPYDNAICESTFASLRKKKSIDSYIKTLMN